MGPVKPVANWTGAAQERELRRTRLPVASRRKTSVPEPSAKPETLETPGTVQTVAPWVELGMVRDLLEKDYKK